MTEKKTLVPKLRFPEFRNSDGWTEKPLGKFLKESRLPGSKGNVAKKITVKLWGNGVFEKSDAVRGSINTQYFRRKAGQFIYSKLDFLNQAFGIIPPNLDNFESTVDLPCFDFSDELNPVFLLEYVKRRDFYERLGETADGSRKARRIHAETFLSFPIALPSPYEQQKIAEFLSSVEELIAAQARKVDALKTHKKGLMQQLFPREGETQPRLRFPEFQNAEGWVREKLGDFADVSASGDLNSSTFSPERSEDHCFPIYSNAIEKEGLYGFSSVARSKANSVTITARGTLGRAFLRTTNFVGIGRLIIVKNFETKANSAFLKECWNHLAVIPQEVTSIPQLTAVAARATALPFPSLPEQERIATCLSSLDVQITAEAQKLETLKTHKKGLMQQLFPSPQEAEA